MKTKEITTLINEKLEKNSKKIIITFFDLKVKLNLSDKELLSVEYAIADLLKEMGYKVYRTTQKYFYRGKECTVESNELIVAIK